ncbi:hypothetical protein LEP1GSC202_2875 [Leptospira yanagawae serovar Saopaulo str. Sao Paulo = ATCC 700523]|uniref:Uncharacterized protein n=1 Tax=Leptospira yanagawae serovar Saopaulo str. Sao Paulo = ATCC 700523 TaxID=1249483 RepID=A0A5E8H9Z6_9LEPT|nr:hypothetical protein [Leptospira yanagawae]EOQ87470.1 hypothetical protein LEP1GSC202_2875 [Leptospira yanagawae serovar Saopaulo str. Sao Paulo = ATCC 700523]
MRWKASQFWKNASPNELLSFFLSIEKGEDLRSLANHMLEDHEFCDLVFEYLWLLRSEDATKKFLNDENIKPDLLMKFIYFGYGKQFLLDQFDSNSYFLQIRQLFGSSQSLRILSLGEEMDRDPTLKIHLLSNLDPQTWEAYFDLLEEKNMTMQTLLGIFSNLRENEIRKILLNSHTLYYYLRMMMVSGKQSNEDTTGKEKENRIRLESILTAIHVWETFCQELKEKYDLTKEKSLAPNKRDSYRLSLVLKELVKVQAQDRSDVLVYLKGNGVILDSWEETTVLSALGNYDKVGKYF